MLSQLPQEIVINIARCLNFYAKLNLAKTCRKLYTLLYDTMLYEELPLPRSCMLQVLILFKNKILDGSKVKLCYFDYLPDNQYLVELPKIFPNLINSIAHESYSHNQLTFFHWINETTHIEYGPYKKISHSIPLTYIPKCQIKNLKRLTLFELNRTFLYISDYLQRLKDFTSLKSLILHELSVSIHMLETIHSNCVGLEHLEMFPTRPVLGDFRFDHLIEPADSLKSLKIEGGSSNLFLNWSFLKYIIQKYPNLKTFKYSSKHEIPHENMNQVTSIGSNYILPKVMTKLVDQIQSFHIESCLFEYIMNKTDLAPTNIRDLGFYIRCPCHSKLFESMKVFNLIQSLNSLTSLTLPLPQALKLYNDRIILPNLKHLFIGDKFAKQYGYITLKLDKLLHIYQSLESIKINDPSCIISLDCISNSKYLPLYSVEFNVCRIEPQITTFIKDFLPNVNRLKLIARDIPEEIIFDFPEHTFYTFDAAFLPSCNRMIYYHVSTQAATRMIKYIYSFGVHPRRVKELNANEWSQKLLNKSNLFKIACKNLFELKFNGVIIF